MNYPYPSYKFIYHENKSFISTLFNKLKQGVYKLEDSTSITIASSNPPELNFCQALSVYEDIQWFTFFIARHKDDLFKSVPLAKVTTPIGSVVVMRNGRNIGSHNILIYHCDTKKFYFRKGIKKMVKLISLLLAECEDLPLYVGTFTKKEDKKDLKIFESRLREAA